MQIKSELSFIEKVTLVMLAMFAVSLFNLAGYIMAVMFILTFVFTNKQQLKVNMPFATLLLFSISFFTIYMSFWSVGIKDVIVFFIAPWASYLFGVILVYRSNYQWIFEVLVIILAIGFFVHGLLNLYMLIDIVGLGTGYRIAFDFWRRELISVTGCALYYVPLIGLSIGYLFFGKNKLLKILSLLSFSLGMFANIVYINRTAVYLSAILLAIAIASVFLKRYISSKFWTGVISVIIIVVVIFAYDIAGIRTQILNLEVYSRLQGDDVGRWSVWSDFITSDWWKYPFGGKQASIQRGFAHNLWLDVLYSVGYIPFILLVIFTFQSINIVKDFYRFDPENRIVYIYMILAMLINAFVEPIIEANPYYFFVILIIIGAMFGQTRKDSMQNNENCIIE